MENRQIYYIHRVNYDVDLTYEWRPDGLHVDDHQYEARIDSPGVYAQSLAALCDEDADRNDSPLRFLHQKLADMISCQFGADAATMIMWELAERGGLHTMNDED